MAPVTSMTEVLPWKNMSFYEGQGEEGEFPIMCDRSWSVWSSV